MYEPRAESHNIIGYPFLSQFATAAPDVVTLRACGCGFHEKWARVVVNGGTLPTLAAEPEPHVRAAANSRSSH